MRSSIFITFSLLFTWVLRTTELFYQLIQYQNIINSLNGKVLTLNFDCSSGIIGKAFNIDLWQEGQFMFEKLYFFRISDAHQKHDLQIRNRIWRYRFGPILYFVYCIGISTVKKQHYLPSIFHSIFCR